MTTPAGYINYTYATEANEKALTTGRRVSIQLSRYKFLSAVEIVDRPMNEDNTVSRVDVLKAPSVQIKSLENSPRTPFLPPSILASFVIMRDSRLTDE
jgi:hypothetical protein